MPRFSFLCNYGQAEGFEQPSVSSFVCGSPLHGGDKGCLYFSDSRQVKKVWKNQEKGGRWWFRTIISTDGKAIARTRRQTIPALQVGFAIRSVQVMPDGRLIVFGDGGFYEYREGQLVCLLGFDDYKRNGPRTQRGEPEIPTQGIMGADGVFYVGTYFSGSGYGGKNPAIWRVSA